MPQTTVSATPTEIAISDGVAVLFLHNGSDRAPVRVAVAGAAPSASSSGPLIAPGQWAKVSGLVDADKVWVWTAGAPGDEARILAWEA